MPGKRVNAQAEPVKRVDVPKKGFTLVQGQVFEALPSAMFRIKLDSGEEVLGHLSGKMRMHYIKILPGDRVTLEMSEYDKAKGRIVRRL